jgi:hypothetical protein
LADNGSTDNTRSASGQDDLSKEAKELLGSVLILERDNVHLEKPRVRKELTELIKNHVR